MKTKLTTTLMLLLISKSILGFELTLDSPFLFYTLKIKSNYMEIKGTKIDMSMKEKKCNNNIIEDLSYKIRSKVKGRIHIESYMKNSYSYYVGKKQYFAIKEDAFSKYLLLIPHLFQRAKTNSALNCKKISTKN